MQCYRSTLEFATASVLIESGQDQAAQADQVNQTYQAEQIQSSSRLSGREMFMASEKKMCVKRELYKTELCRHYVLREQCPYKDKCQFAHGSEEIVDIIRHPKYKTELCKGYHSTGFCPYGPRCHFIHADPEDNNRTSLAVRPMGNARERWSTSTNSGHGKEVWEAANDWQNEDQEMPTDWMNKDQELPMIG